ncbi:uncharacterized protein [Asterias amurensis]|uniref:uncharacterized protein n=1 Tax=Asterias amurensis TaxID=7602 RepID=UPI003AB54E2B
MSITKEASQIIIASWRSGTKKCYKSAFDRWIQFCTRTETHPIRPTLVKVLDFLTKQFLSGSQYSSLNITRSALSAVIPTLEGVTVGSHPLVKRLMKGVFNLRPPKARHSHTWDVTVVLDYLRTLGPNEGLSLKKLTMKLVVLTALTSGQRCQTLSFMNIKGGEKKLFRSYVPPHKAVGSETIGRWIKLGLSDAGIRTDKFTAHSTRAAACSAASRKGVPLATIMKAAGWSRSSTFAKFYNKPVEDTGEYNCFAESILSHSAFSQNK